MKSPTACMLAVWLGFGCSGPLAYAEAPEPGLLLRDFLGLNVHTVSFKPELYAPVAQVLRNYHPIEWDLGKQTGVLPAFPLAKNKVDWSALYGRWKQAGYKVHASLMFSALPPDRWMDPAKDPAAYGDAFARYFGPAGNGLVEAVEIGNEPGKYSDKEYAALFSSMAAAIRLGDPKLRISTCAVKAGASDPYLRNVEVFRPYADLYDILSVHTYAQVEGWPTWRRTFPESDASPFLREVRDITAWRDKNAPGKQVWVTEYGWDAWSGQGERINEFVKWEDVSDEAQAAYLVRASVLLRHEGADRAHIYFFNDEDHAQVHGSSGLTRKYQPKPAFWAIRQLQQNLGATYLDALAVRDGVYAARFLKQKDSRPCWLLWRAEPDGEAARPYLFGIANIQRIEPMVLASEPPDKLEAKRTEQGWEIPVGPRPLYVWE